MKKSKLLIPLVSIAGLGAAITPAVLATSCGKTVTNVKIVATTELTVVSSQDVIRKDEILVRVYRSDNTSELITNWTCDKFIADQYTVTADDLAKGTVSFTVKLGELVSSVSIKVSDIKELNAKYKWGSNVYCGTQIYKDDIEVRGTTKSGEVIILNSDQWTCGKLSTGVYMVTDNDETAGHVDFEIKYLNLQPATVSIPVAPIQRCTFITDFVTLIKSTSQNKFSSLKEVFLFAVGGLNPQRVSASNFDFKYFEGTEEIPDSPVSVKLVPGRNTYAFYIKNESYQFPTGSKHIIKAYAKGKSTPLAEIEVKIAVDTFLATFSTDNTAQLTLSAEMEETEDTLIVPEFLQYDSDYYSVTGLRKKDGTALKGVVNLILPKSITFIEGHLFDHKSDEANKALRNIVFMGTSEEWQLIDDGEDWQGDVAMNAYCYGDDKWVDFENRYSSDFVKSAELFGSQPTFVSSKKIGSTLSDSYIIEFNLKEIIDTTGKQNYKKFKYIEVYHNVFRALTIDAVYVNGGYLAKITSEAEQEGAVGYVIDNNTAFGTKIHLANVTLGEQDLITVRIVTPRFSSDCYTVGLHTNGTWEN